MAEESGTERTDDLDELRQRIAAIETDTQRREPVTNDGDRTAGRTDVRQSSSLRRSSLQRKRPLRRVRKTN